MTAAQLVTALLDEGEDPKAFLARHAPRLRLPGPDEVDYNLSADWEQEDPRHHFEFPEDIEMARQAIRDGNVWGWCSVRVEATFMAEDGVTYEGVDTLGGCSYASRADFMTPGGYYDDMKKQAYDELCAKLEKIGYR